MNSESSALSTQPGAAGTTSGTSGHAGTSGALLRGEEDACPGAVRGAGRA